MLISGPHGHDSCGSTPRTMSTRARAVLLAQQVHGRDELRRTRPRLPSGARAMPGASLIVATASTSSVLESSPVAPARSTIARSGLPVASTASDKLRVNAEHRQHDGHDAGDADDDDRRAAERCGTLRKFMAVTDAICLNTLMCRDLLRSPLASTSRERVDDAEPLRPQRRQRRADDANAAAKPRPIATTDNGRFSPPAPNSR